MKAKYLSILITEIFMGMAHAVTLSDGVSLGATNTVPAGSNSIAAGDSNHATGNSVAIGYWNQSDSASLVAGESSSSLGWACFSGGAFHVIDNSSYASFAGGEGQNIANSEGGVALGYYNTMNNQVGSVAVGVGNSINFPTAQWGTGNIALGQNNVIDATGPSAPADLQGTVLIGAGNQSSSRMAFALGLCNIAQSETVTIGTYAQPVENAALIVGKGSSSAGRSNGLVVLKNGEVQITGSLVVGGSSILTQANASQPLQNLGFVNTAYLASNNYLKKAVGNGATADANAYIAMGAGATAGYDSMAIGLNAKAISNNSIALGENSNAANSYSTALQGGYAEGVNSFAANWGFAGGEYSVGLAGGWALAPMAISIGGFDETTWWINEASGKGSVAIGGLTNGAYGDYSYAFGWNSCAIGSHSQAIGHLTRSMAFATALGSQNLSAGNAIGHMSSTEWLEEGALFELGNGKPSAAGQPATEFSNAITTLKNGQTTLTNKAWKADSNVTPAVANSNAEALVVEGHTRLEGDTRLKGKVIIEQPQGDISMGDYQ
jgi:hypothetical protein